MYRTLLSHAVPAIAALATIALHATAQTPQEAIDEADALFEAKEWAKAADAFAAIYAVDKQNTSAAFKMGYAHHAAGNFQRAIDAYMEIADPGGPIVFYNLGCAYARMGKSESALSWLDRAAAAGFAEAKLVAEDEDLATVRSDSRFDGFARRVKSNAFPCAEDPNARALDFWVGNWEVRDKAGNLMGHNTVDLVLGQCALIENWSGAMGMSGKSIAVFNKEKKGWQQTWVTDRGEVLNYTNGEMSNGAMRFTARVTKMEKELMLRLSFYKIDENTVRQVGESSLDDGKTWTVNYDFTYTREGKQASVPLDR